MVLVHYTHHSCGLCHTFNVQFSLTKLAARAINSLLHVRLLRNYLRLTYYKTVRSV